MKTRVTIDQQLVKDLRDCNLLRVTCTSILQYYIAILQCSREDNIWFSCKYLWRGCMQYEYVHYF